MEFSNTVSVGLSPFCKQCKDEREVVKANSIHHCIVDEHSSEQHISVYTAITSIMRKELYPCGQC